MEIHFNILYLMLIIANFHFESTSGMDRCLPSWLSKSRKFKQIDRRESGRSVPEARATLQREEANALKQHEVDTELNLYKIYDDLINDRLKYQNDERLTAKQKEIIKMEIDTYTKKKQHIYDWFKKSEKMAILRERFEIQSTDEESGPSSSSQQR